MIIIHAGMHKTGSTSIQSTFARLDGNRVDIPPRRGVNCNIWFYELFVQLAKSPEISPEEIVDTRHRLLGQTLERRRPGRALHPLLISGEDMSYDHEHAEIGLIAMAEYLREHSGEDVRVIAYVRPPRSFISSWFQQKSRGIIRKTMIAPDARRWQTVPNAYWPRYRARFEKFDTIFGRENVTLKPFQRERLEGGDVVLDFAREIGVALDPGEVVRARESLSLEVVALLYVRQRFGKQRKKIEQPRGRHGYFVRQISTLGARRFVFADTATDPLVEAHRADLDWMEARLGVPLSEPAVPEGEGIGSEAELIAVALAARPLVEGRIAQVIAALPARDIPDCDLSVPDVPDADRPVYELARRLDFLGDLLKPPAPEQGRRKKKPSRREQGRRKKVTS